MHLYRKDCLQILATRFGQYLGMDNATLDCTHTSRARICMEVNLTMDPMQGFPIVVSNTKCIWQEAKYEKPGFFVKNVLGKGTLSWFIKLVRKGMKEAN